MVPETPLQRSLVLLLAHLSVEQRITLRESGWVQERGYTILSVEAHNPRYGYGEAYKRGHGYDVVAPYRGDTCSFLTLFDDHGNEATDPLPWPDIMLSKLLAIRSGHFPGQY